jgi:hypothetical protein
VFDVFGFERRPGDHSDNRWFFASFLLTIPDDVFSTSSIRVALQGEPWHCD